MEQPRRSLILRTMRGLGRGVDLSRRLAVNLIFVLIVVLLVGLLLDRGPKVPKGAALVVAPAGAIVEQLSGDATQRALDRLGGRAVIETRLGDLLAGIRAAREDDRIAALVLDLSRVDRAGMSKLRDLGQAIAEFRASGKRVVATADFYSQTAFYLAAQADEIHLSPQGLVLLPGFGIYRPYYKAGLDLYEIDAHVFRVGEFKSAVEPYLRNDVSPEARESYLDVLGGLWGSYLEAVAAGRKTTPERLAATIDRVDELLATAGGDGARLSLESGLVDHLSNRDEVRARLIELVGEDEKEKSFRRIGLADYLAANGLDQRRKVKGEAVAVVVAAGTIRDGSHPSGTIGGDSTAALVRRAREKEKVKAIVLRVDSPGGSAFASEVVRRELALARAGGKPVVVSMGSVAASGGYWISTASDRIFADPTTITGSIGIFGVLPTFEKPLAKYLGVRVDGVGTTWLAGALRPDRALEPRLGAMIQSMIEHGYEDFLARVGEARHMERDAVDRLARGRIWTGAEAARLGLVDELGGFDAAVAAAGRLAGLGERPALQWIEQERGWRDRLAERLFRAAERFAPEAAAPPHRPLSAAGRLRAALAELEALAQLDDPRGLLAHCFCEIDG